MAVGSSEGKVRCSTFSKSNIYSTVQLCQAYFCFFIGLVMVA